MYLFQDSMPEILVKAIAASYGKKNFSPFNEVSKLALFLCKTKEEMLLKNILTHNARTLTQVEFLEIRSIFSRLCNFYSGLGRVDSLLIGPPLGSFSFLSVFMESFFLPINAFIKVKHGKQSRTITFNAEKVYELSAKVSAQILKKNKDVVVSAIYDPVHGRKLHEKCLILNVVMKKLVTPYGYFLEKALKESGAIVLLDVDLKWMQFNPHPDFFFQIGAFGGIKDKEYFDEMREKESFKLKDLNVSVLPTLEFKCPNQLKKDIEEFCKKHNRKFIYLSSNDPRKYSELIAKLYMKGFKVEGRPFNKVFLCSGAFIDPCFCLETRSIPVWIPDVLMNNYRFAKKILEELKKETSLVVAVLTPVFNPSNDIAPLSKWTELLGEFESHIIICLDDEKYPLHFKSSLNFSKEKKYFMAREKDKVAVRATGDDLIEIAEEIGLKVEVNEKM